MFYKFVLSIALISYDNFLFFLQCV